MEKENNTPNAWKQALERRQTESLSSNFSYRMMERVRKEAVKQQKRKTLLAWAALITSALFVLGTGVYFLFFYLDFRFAGSMPPSDAIGQDTFLFRFYGSVAVLALALLGLDYWLRKKYIWK